MKPLKIICFVLLLGFAGCTSVQLKYNTLQQGQSLTDLEYEMVLDNIAMQKDSPGALPWHATITKASITINDVVTPSGAYEDRDAAEQHPQPGHFAETTWQGDWTFTPVVDPSVLTNLLAIYKKAAKANSNVVGYAIGFIPALRTRSTRPIADTTAQPMCGWIKRPPVCPAWTGRPFKF